MFKNDIIHIMFELDDRNPYEFIVWDEENIVFLPYLTRPAGICLLACLGPAWPAWDLSETCPGPA